jgi:hypothetical protein
MQIVENTHQIILHYSPTRLKESNSEAVRAKCFVSIHTKQRLNLTKETPTHPI